MTRARPGAVTWTGLGTVLVCAAVLSFDSLRGLAVSCRVSPALAWLLPVGVDAGAAVATRAWLSRRANRDAEHFARRMTWGLLALTVVGNAAHQGMAAHNVSPPWWVAVAVGAVPPVVVGACVHLAVLLGRDVQERVQEDVQEAEAPTDVSEPAEQSHPAPADVLIPQSTGHQLEPAPEPVEATPAPRRNPPAKDRTDAKAAAAERSARSRRHKSGDHSTCLPGRCPHADAPTNGATIREAVLA